MSKDEHIAALQRANELLQRDNAQLQRDNALLRRDKAQLQRDNEQLQQVNAQLQLKLDASLAENRRLRSLLEESEREKHRQVVRFARRERVKQPKKPGRPKGHAPSRRELPTKVDRVVDAPLGSCPNCGGAGRSDKVLPQFQIDLPPVTPIVTQFNVHCGHCSCCGKYLQGRHPEQISDALGAAGVQIGPTLLTMAAEMKHRLGVTYRKISDFFGNYLDISIAPATFCRAEQRLAKKAGPTYALLLDALRLCEIVHADETGWRVAMLNAWLWVFTSRDVTIYAIRTGKGARGKQVPLEILGPDFDGILIVDGLASYDALECQKGRCNGHILRRAHRLESAAAPNNARYLRRLIDIFKDARSLVQSTLPMTETEYWDAVDAVHARLDQWLAFFGYDPSEELIKLAKHLRHYRDEWFRFLDEPEMPSTNDHAERMLRPAVVTRRIGACNRTLLGALTHSVLTSIMVTWRQRGWDLMQTALELWRSPTPIVAPVLQQAMK